MNFSKTWQKFDRRTSLEHQFLFFFRKSVTIKLVHYPLDYPLHVLHHSTFDSQNIDNQPSVITSQILKSIKTIQL